MIVLDASAAVELLLALPLSKRVQQQVERAEWQLAAPQLLVLEVIQVFRRRVLGGLTPPDVAEDGRQLLGELGIRYFDHPPLVERVWELRNNVTAYDASYLALSEALDAELVTTDARLASAAGHAARICLVQ
ncbi:MAG: type II toxin-antitoxin system VapC family toxin [Propioniciclava sp.]